MMEFSKEVRERINDNYLEKIRTRTHCGEAYKGLECSVTFTNSVGVGMMGVCNVTKLTQLIDELTDLRQAILEETGIKF